MPFKDVDDLRASPLFKRLGRAVEGLSTTKLARFVAVFNAVHARFTRGGMDPSEAEARSIPFGLTAARKMVPPPANRTAEASRHVFALMAPHMSSASAIDGDESVDLTVPDAAFINEVVAGGTFNNGHDPTDPLGIIHEVVATADLPPELRTSADPDIPVVAIASYFDDVPADERLATISPEWLEFTSDSGVLAIPHSFAITSNPANPAESGIRQIATGGSANPNKTAATIRGQGLPMPDEVPDESKAMLAKIAELESQKAEEEQARVAAQAEVEAINARLAAISGNPPEGVGKEFDAKEAIASLEAYKTESEARIAKAEAHVEEMRLATAQAEGEAFLKEEGLAKGRIAADATDIWVEDYVADPERTKKRLASIPEGQHLGAHLATAAESAVAKTAAEAEDLKKLATELF